MSKRTYRAFISYSHRDARWGKWLQNSLEGYRIPKDLIGRETDAGTVPKTLRPIFRDRLDLSAGPSLQDQLDQALEASENLIVICSPASAGSEYVNEEVRRFKALGRADRILAIIVDGDPGADDDQNCFPRALRFLVDEQGEITNHALEPVGADVRPEADGKDLAKLKVISGLLGLDLDDLRRREAIAERRRKRVLYGVAASMAVLAILASGTAVRNYFLLTENQKLVKTQVKLIDDTLDRATELMGDAVEFSRREGIPVAMSQRILRQVEEMFQALAETGLAEQNPTLKEREAVMLIRLGQNLGILGNTEKREDYARRAVTIIEPLVTKGTARPELRSILAWAYTVLGRTYTAKGNLPEALEYIRRGFDMREDLVKLDPKNVRWRRSLSNSHARIGDVQLAMGNTEAALASYRTALQMKEQLAAKGDGTYELREELSGVHIHIARVLERRGDAEAALASFKSGLAILDKLAATEPLNVDWSRERAVVQAAIADFHLHKGEIEEARRWYDQSFEIRKRLAVADQENLPRQSDLAFGYTNYGELYFAQNLFEEALKEHRKAFEIRKRLHEADPANASWTLNLGQSLRHIGDVFQRSGKLDDALNSYGAQRELLEELVAEDRTNLAWTLDLAQNLIATGAAQSQLNRIEDALKTYRTAAEMEAKIALADHTNVRVYEDLFNIRNIMGNILQRLGKPQEAAASYEKARNAAKHLAGLRPHGLRIKAYLARMLERLAIIRRDEGDVELAVVIFEESLPLRHDLHKAYPGHSRTIGDLAFIQFRTASLHARQGRTERALQLLRNGAEIITPLAEKEPDVERWQLIKAGIQKQIAALETGD